MNIFKYFDYGIGVYTIFWIIRLLYLIYKPHTPFLGYTGNIPSMNFCKACGRPIGQACPMCARSTEPELLFGATPVKAMRVFVVHLDTLTLHSLNSGIAFRGMGEAWIPGETKTANCAIHSRVSRIRYVYGDQIEIPGYDPSHEAPVWGCTCGIWSCKSREALAKTVPVPNRISNQPVSRLHFTGQTLYVSAQIHQWGKVVEHAWGYRSQHARIIPESIQIYPRNIKTARDKKLVETLRRKYSNG